MSAWKLEESLFLIYWSFLSMDQPLGWLYNLIQFTRGILIKTNPHTSTKIFNVLWLICLGTSFQFLLTKIEKNNICCCCNKQKPFFKKKISKFDGALVHVPHPLSVCDFFSCRRPAGCGCWLGAVQLGARPQAVCCTALRLSLVR